MSDGENIENIQRGWNYGTCPWAILPGCAMEGFDGEAGM